MALSISPLADTIPIREGSQSEPKWDDSLCLAFKDEDQIELQSKSGQSLTPYFPELVSALQEIKSKKFILAGKIVNSKDESFSFDDLLQRIHHAAHPVQKLSENYHAKMIIFDLLVFGNWKLLDSEPLKQRRKFLEIFFVQYLAQSPTFQLSPATCQVDIARRWLEMANVMIEGLAAKRMALTYKSGEQTGRQRIKRGSARGVEQLKPASEENDTAMIDLNAVSICRRIPIGAEVLADGQTHFRIWAPLCQKVEVIVEGPASKDTTVVELAAEPDGYFSGRTCRAKPGDLYRYRLDGNDVLLPDPASRFQPEGPLGPSMIIDPAHFAWHDLNWKGVTIEGQVIYEMHIGTFTAEGTWKAAGQRLKALKDLGVTVLEIMPVHDFCGRHGWGYDGVDFFAPTRLYGRPDDFRAFIDDAHGLGLGVILDVVYNHAGPIGNYLKSFSPDYFTDRHSTDWGDAFNFDGSNSGPVREFFVANAGYWIEEFHLDGLRLDATQNIYDSSEVHILAEITAAARRAAGRRSIIITAENEPQNVQLIRSSESGGYGMDALWNDDFHHSAMVALSGHNEAYYSDHRGTPQEFVSAAKRGFLYQGQYYSWQRQRRGTCTAGLKPAAFIHFLQNHDQVANLGLGHRAHQISHPGDYRAMTALLLLAPQTPLLFQGQEFAASSPFVFFADHNSELGCKIKQGRFEFLKQFPSLANPDTQKRLPDPNDPKSFKSCRLDFTERNRHHAAYALHRDLLRVRHSDPVIKTQRPGGVDGAVLTNDAFVLRFFAEDGNDRLLIINLGLDCSLTPAPEPLLASPAGSTWRLLWSSEDPCYGGYGATPIEDENRWFIPGKAAFLLAVSES